MARKVISSFAVLALIALGVAPAAGATTATRLLLSQSAAFSILGHSCGGIQEQVYATGFQASGYPTGDVYLQTSCGGSGRGGGYKSTTYSAWASTSWDWVGDTRTYARLEGVAEGIGTSFSAEDGYGDRIYNVGTAAYLEAPAPPIVPPGAPTGVTTVSSPIESGEELVLRFQVGWTPAPASASAITSSTVTATPVGSAAPVLSATTSGPTTGALIGPLQPHTYYDVTVTNTDAEGTSQPSGAIEAYSDGAPPPPPAVETCEQNQGTIKLAPGLGETPHVQNITVKGRLKACDGAKDVTEATYVAHLKTIEAVTCSQLTSISAEPATVPVSLVVKWSPSQAGTSGGALVMPVTEIYGEALSGTIAGGPFGEPLGIFASSVSESFTGGPMCGVPQGRKKKAKAVKSGTFTSAPVEIGG